MTKLTLLIGAACVVLTPPTALIGQEAEPDSATVRAARRTLMSDLRNFVTAQEMYFADNSTYAPSMRAMREIYHPSPTVTFILLTSSDRGHSEIAIDERAPGLVCAMHIGNSPAPLGKGGEGEVVCRGP